MCYTVCNIGKFFFEMVRNYVRKSERQSWSLISMNKAVNEVLNKIMTHRRAQHSYEILRSTLLRMVVIILLKINYVVLKYIHNK